MIGAQRVSLTLALIAFLTGIVYLGPSFWVERGTGEGEQLGIVETINSWGPVWPVMFLVAAVILAASAVSRRYVGYTHAVVAGMWGFYGTAVLMSAVYAEPPLPVLSGGIALGAALLHLAMIRVWADLGVK
ncbi:hypothetical protein DEU38_103186 [Rhodococcus sp. AG1013]|uniref:hypothetical protein n=1 Tax=Rhodococcus sp. AG1013 TaxID=2183996 RepID=UPI000E0ABDC9|nr:hypothetical protein [Rhodococcus sp. AG1013]RDI32453.1 hypothetical protein DEU38_103186 [Rhodococcus sp. AG1013]